MSAKADNPPRRIPLHERLIFALDVPDVAAAKALVTSLAGSVSFYKIGLELAASRHYFDLLDWLLERDKKVFADLKLYDIPATVAAAVRQLAKSGATFLTIHGDRAIMQAAASEKGSTLQVLAVTVLTSLGQSELEQMGIRSDIGTLVLERAKQAVLAGCDGVIASGLEAQRLRTELGPGPLIVTPGIRPAGKQGSDDQRRIVTPARALQSGADHIVVGRPIRDAASPYEAAAAIQAEIAAVLG
ncbi:MAG TPA: orotidine-5'-phosphate decarboxylase [Gammaproteobacteria bacterium]|nr:orotidine-5'-phosphate decarboxylase [Gammaproteobacteria bacterium]